MMSLMDDEKKKQDQIGQNPLEDRLFNAVKSGDKKAFISSLKLLIKEIMFENEMPEEDESEIEFEGEF